MNTTALFVSCISKLTKGQQRMVSGPDSACGPPIENPWAMIIKPLAVKYSRHAHYNY